MGMSMDEQRRLAAIEDELAGSDGRLVRRLATFGGPTAVLDRLAGAARRHPWPAAVFAAVTGIVLVMGALAAAWGSADLGAWSAVLGTLVATALALAVPGLGPDGGEPPRR